MADLVSYGNADRDIEQALIALKKELNYLNMVAVFQRYLRPEKEYLSFSLIYNDGKDPLTWLICKDKVEAEIWIAGLKALTSSGQAGRSKIDGWSDGGFYFDDNRDLTSNSPSNSSFSATREVSSSDVSTSSNITASPKTYRPDNLIYSERSHVALDQTNMQVKGSGSDAFRVSVSSAPSTSSHGSAPDDCDALGDVYIWGEVMCDNVVKVGPEKNASSITTRADILLPRPLESNVVLDVHYIACGVRHAVLASLGKAKSSVGAKNLVDASVMELEKMPLSLDLSNL
ncbi:hypothetical protein DH2020_047482 [Rehmannia glutinosa]|uniref:PH domain-containing protein n=1 Tax=Rehmannia glutinosa TaxID=99300 RepID=A0ABR0U8L1_REHGL